MSGVRTAKLAIDIGKWIKDEGFAGLKVYCSHRGGLSLEDFTNAGVDLKGCGLFVGAGHTHKNRFGLVDIVVAKLVDKGSKAIIVFEGEERRGGIRPKDVVADAIMPVLADRLEIKGKPPKPMAIDGALVLVAFHQRTGDDRKRTAELAKLLQKLAQSITEDRAVKNVELLSDTPELLWPAILERIKQSIQARGVVPGAVIPPRERRPSEA